MASTTKKFFLDTNIFVSTFDSASASKRRRAVGLITEALDSRRGIISYQVVQEFLNVATRKFSKRMAAADAQLYLDRILMPLCEVFPAKSLYSEALSISAESRLSFYDSLIVGSAITGGCGLLWTEDLQHGQRIRGIEIRNPFAA